jgi:transcription antitermination factor NusG
MLNGCKRIEQDCWFAARTRCGAELGVRQRLTGLCVENFLPTELRSRTRGHSQYEKPLIPGIIFVRTTKPQACALANEMGVPVRYMIDSATRTLLVVPDKQMEDFRRVLDLSIMEGGLIDRPLELGDHVRVTKGVLSGVEGRVVDFKGKTYVVVDLLGCIFARASVPRAWLELIRDN